MRTNSRPIPPTSDQSLNPQVVFSASPKEEADAGILISFVPKEIYRCFKAAIRGKI